MDFRDHRFYHLRFVELLLISDQTSGTEVRILYLLPAERLHDSLCVRLHGSCLLFHDNKGLRRGDKGSIGSDYLWVLPGNKRSHAAFVRLSQCCLSEFRDCLRGASQLGFRFSLPSEQSGIKRLKSQVYLNWNAIRLPGDFSGNF